MKALIVSESKHETALIETYVKQAGYEHITYGWFLKAMDNIEEISPELIIINAVDYPRHWKVLAQYVKSFQHMQIILFASETYFDEEEQKKADFLGIKGVVTGFSPEDISKFNSLVLEEKQPVPCKDEGKGTLLFLHPVDETIYTGCITSLSSNELTITPDKLTQLDPGDIVEDMALKTMDGIKGVQAEVIQAQKDSITFAFK